MKKTLLFLLAAALLAGRIVFAETQQPAAVKLQGMSPELADRITALVQNGMAEDHAPGLVVGIVEGSTLVYAGAFGWADLAAQKPVDESTLFRIGSISKTATAIGLMQQWEQGKFQLDDDANRYLPEPLLFPPHPTEQPITFQRLLTHTSGGGEFLAYSQALKLGRDVLVQGENYLPLEHYLTLGMTTKVGPGRKWAYCNYGFAFLGLALETLAGEPFHLYMQKHLFEPLGMTHSTFRHTEAVLAQTAVGYKYRHGEYKIDQPKLPGLTPPGNLFTNLPDMGRYVIALLNGGKNQTGRVLKPETLAMMMQTQYTLDPRQMGWGLGFQVYGNNLWGRRVVGHSGAIPFGFISQMLLLPDERIGVYAFSNSETRAPIVIAWAVLKQVLGVKDDAAVVGATGRSPLPLTDRQHELIGYYGPEYRDFKTSTRLYMNGIGAYRVKERDGELVFIYAWQGKNSAKPLHPVSADDPEFFWIENEKSPIPTYLAFRSDEDGRVFIVPGGLNEYVRLGPGRTFKARLMVGPARILALVNPF